MRQVYLPLQELDQCHVCGNTKSLRLCSSCAERIYCSTECQKKDWPSHKTNCGKTERIDLSTFYPLLAGLFDLSRIHRDMTLHPALEHVIVNSPNPGTLPSSLPDGSSAKVVRLGRRMTDADRFPNGDPGNLAPWWPKGSSNTVRAKLRRRILREGHTLPIALSICIGLLSEFYTTTSGGNSGKKRIRLRYRSSPIADFGIAAGSARVTAEDKLAYILPDGSVRKGQDPDDHYWIYFTTLRGEEVVLDCGAFTFNMCICVNPKDYLPFGTAEIVPPYVPAYFKDRPYSTLPRDLHTETRRASVLRNKMLHEAVMQSKEGALTSHEVENMREFMWDISRGTVAAEDLEMLPEWVIMQMSALESSLQSEAWKRFPATPPMGIETDPGESYM